MLKKLPESQKIFIVFYSVHSGSAMVEGCNKQICDQTGEHHPSWKGREDEEAGSACGLKQQGEKEILLPLPVGPTDSVKLVPTNDHHFCCTLNLQYSVVYTTACHLTKRHNLKRYIQILWIWQGHLYNCEAVFLPKVIKEKTKFRNIFLTLPFLPTCRRRTLYCSNTE